MIFYALLHHPERQLLWHPPINTDFLSLSVRRREITVCCFLPLFQVWFCRVVEIMFSLPSLPVLLASVTAGNSRAPGKCSGLWLQKSEQNVNFHALEVNQAANSQKLYILPGYLPRGSKAAWYCHHSYSRKELWAAIFHTIDALLTPRRAACSPGTAREALVRSPETSLPRRKWKGGHWTHQLPLQRTATRCLPELR